jgi:hypothetical protein
MSVDGTNIVTLSELYTLTTKLDTARALPIDIVRRGQPLRLVMPPPAGMAAPGMVPPGMVPPGMVPPGMAAPDMAAPGMAAPGMAALGMAAPGVGMPQPMNAPSAMGGAPGSKMCPHCGGALAP